MNELPQHPFGRDITFAQLQASFAECTQWEDRYRLLIKLSRELPPLPLAWRTAEIEVYGCENRVWLGYKIHADGTLRFYGDSEGRIVKGLLAILLSLAEGQSPQQLLATSFAECLATLGLSQQLSTSRHNGITALSVAFNQAAQQALTASCSGLCTV